MPSVVSLLARAVIAPIALVAGSAAVCSAQQRSASIEGVVRDSATGETLPHAQVIVTELRRGAVSNADGRFVVLGVPRGAYTLRVVYIGYRSVERRLHTDSIRAPLSIDLSRTALRLATSMVTAGRDEVIAAAIAPAVSQIAISTAAVETMPSVGEADVFRTLQMLPSVRAAGDGSATLSVRGGTSDQNLVLLDGMTVYHVDHFFGLFSAFNTDALKDIQLFAGGFPAKYGGRLSSVVDLTGKAGDERTLRASGGMNLLSARGVVEVPLGRGAWLFSARRSYTDIVRSPLYNSLFKFAGGESSTPSTRGNRPGGAGGQVRFQSQSVEPAFYFYDVNSKLTYRPTSRDFVALSLYSGRDNLDKSQQLPGGTVVGGGPGPTLEDVTSWGNLGASVRWFRQWAGRLSSDLLFATSRYTSDGSQTASGGTPNGARFDFGFEETNSVNDATMRLDNELQIARWSRVGFGAALTRNRVAYEFGVNTTDTAQANRNTIREGKAVTTAAYVQHTWAPFAAIDLTTGVRINQYDATDESYVEPRISAGVQVTPSLRLKGAWGRYHQFVNRIENEDVLQGSRDFWLLADTSLTPSVAEHRIAGVAFERPAWGVNVEAYDKDMRDLALFSRRYRQSFGVNAGAFFYVGDGRARGVEMLLQKKTGAVTGWATYTLSKVTNTFADVDRGDPFPASQDQRHEAKAFGAYTFGKWELSATAVYGSGRPYTAPVAQYELALLDGTLATYIHVGPKNGERLPAYARGDVAISRLFQTDALDWRVGLSIYNVANRNNVYYRKFDLSSQPINITDVTQLGFTPSIDVKVTLRDLKNVFGGDAR